MSAATNLHYLELTELAAHIRTREVSPVAVTRAQLDRIASLDGAHEATYPARKGEYGPVLASVIEAGRALSGLDYQKILLRRLDLRGRVATLFGSIDLLLIPVHPLPPPSVAVTRTLGARPDLVSALLRYTCPFDMTGHPTITLPGGFSEAGLPLAFQLVGPAMGEAALVRAGAAFQSVTSWHRRHPVA